MGFATFVCNSLQFTILIKKITELSPKLYNFERARCLDSTYKSS